MNVGSFFIADAQTSPVEEPIKACFDNVAILAQPATVFAAALGDPRDNAQGAEWSKDFIFGVVGRIRQKSIGAATWSAARSLDRRNRLHQWHGHLRIVNIGAGVRDSQRCTVLIGDQVPFRTCFAAIGGIGPGLRPPKTARTEQLSRTPLDQSMASAMPSSSRSRRQMRSQTPACCQSRSRRQQVMPQPQPSSWGRYSHGVPVLSTKSMPSKQLRSGTVGRPPFGLGRGAGITITTFSQSASGKSGLAIRSSLTETEMGQQMSRRVYHRSIFQKREFC